MDDNLTIVPYAPTYGPRIEAWSSQSAMNTLLKLPSATIPSDLSSANHSWVALQGDDPIAIVTVNLDASHVGYLDVLVKPSERRKGVGGTLVEYVLAQPSVQEIHRLRALVELDNVGAQKILIKHGFTKTGYATTGQLEMERH